MQVPYQRNICTMYLGVGAHVFSIDTRDTSVILGFHLRRLCVSWRLDGISRVFDGLWGLRDLFGDFDSIDWDFLRFLRTRR